MFRNRPSRVPGRHVGVGDPAEVLVYVGAAAAADLQHVFLRARLALPARQVRGAAG